MSEIRDGNLQRGLWKEPDVPKDGWLFQRIEDTGKPPSQTCGMCWSHGVRYIHWMHHIHYGDLGVGCVCAGNMQGDLEAAKRRESELKKIAKMRLAWPGRQQWRQSKAKNTYLNTRQWNVVIFPRYDNVWGFRITHKATNKSWPSKKPYEGQEAVKLAAFDAICYIESRDGHSLVEALR